MNNQCLHTNQKIIIKMKWKKVVILITKLLLNKNNNYRKINLHLKMFSRVLSNLNFIKNMNQSIS